MYESGGKCVKGCGRKKRGRETKILKREGNLDQGWVKRGAWNPITNYGTFLNVSVEAQLIKSPGLPN